MDEIKVVLRSPHQADKNFVLSTWLKGQRFGNIHFRAIPSDAYYEKQTELIMDILSTPGIRMTIACDEARPEWIIGFAVFSQDEIYWIHVRSDYRKRGIGKLLLDGAKITTVRAITKIGHIIAENHGLTFKPL